jgi:uncharacterized lipoprotein YddW (UPF0748 family)
MSKNKEPKGCGCSNIPFTVILALLGAGYWLFSQRNNFGISKFLPDSLQTNILFVNPAKTPALLNTPNLAPNLTPHHQQALVQLHQSSWEKKVIRGIYLSRYLATNNADEQTIRQRVRFYRSQGFNTILQGVWGNGCTMYNSDAMQRSVGFKSCPNLFQDQWLDWLDDYLGYYADLPGKVDRTSTLTSFVQQMVAAIKQANPAVSFDICDHNPYWAKRYFAADWQNWHVDRVFIQDYNDANFSQELNYAKNYAGIAIGDRQLYRLKELINNPAIKSVLIFPLARKPEETATQLKSLTQTKN